MTYSKILVAAGIVALGVAVSDSGEAADTLAPADDISKVESKDWFSITNVSFLRPATILIDTTTSGGCEAHDYTLHVSKRVLESYPPVIETKLVLDKNGDACKRIVEAQLEFSLADLGVAGPHVIEIAGGGMKERLLVSLTAAENLTSQPPLKVTIGTPDELGDNLASLDGAEVVSGVDGQVLILDATYGGGCETHDFEAYWDGSVMKSLPPRAAIVLVHRANGDVCRGLMQTKVQIDVDDLVKSNPGIILDIHAIGLPSLSASAP